jgi:hypothetical protein
MKFGLSVPVQHLPDEPGAERMRELLQQVKLGRDLGSASTAFPRASITSLHPSNTFSRFRCWRASPPSRARWH